MPSLNSILFTFYSISYEIWPGLFTFSTRIKYKLMFPGSGVNFDKVPFFPLKLKVGKGSHSSIIHLSINEHSSIIIGENTHIGRDCEFILFSDHSMYDLNKHNEELGKPFKLEIGSDVWIGDRVIIIGSRKIGDHAIIGAGSIITHDVEANSITHGERARHFRYRA